MDTPILVTGAAGSGTTLMCQILQRNIFGNFEDYGGEIIHGINFHLSLPHQIPFQWVDPRDFKGYKKIVMERDPIDTVFSAWRRFYRNYPGEEKTPKDAVDDFMRARRSIVHLLEDEGDSTFVCSYNLLAADPRAEQEGIDLQIDGLCDFLDLPGLTPMGIPLNFSSGLWRHNQEFCEATGNGKLIYRELPAGDPWWF